MPDVARLLCGEPNARLSSATEWRYGKKGSLSVDLVAGTFYCHELADGGGVVDLIRYKAPETAENGGVARWFSENLGIDDEKPKAPFKTVASWDYHDADGAVQYTVTRRENGEGDKTYRQLTARGLKPSADAAFVPLPYQLPEMLAAPDAVVYIAEGEKAADALRAVGLVATTNSGGANNWDKMGRLNKWFEVRQVVILPDNDEPGRRHAASVARHLGGVAAAIKIVELTRLPEKGDAVDYLAARSVEDLRAEVREVEVLEVDSIPVQSVFTVYTLEELEALPEPQFLVEGVLIEGTDAVLYGESEAHKSGTAISMACAVAGGREWMGRKTRQGAVLFVAGEGGALLSRRFAATLKHEGVERAQNIHVISDNVDAYAGEVHIEALTALAEDIRPALIVWDTISQHSGSATENSDEMKNVLRNMRIIARSCGAANLILAHPGKDLERGVRGWSGQKNNIDALFNQRRSEQYITLKCEKQKDAPHFEPIDLRFEIIDDAPVIVPGSQSTVREAVTRISSKNNRRAYTALCNVLARADLAPGFDNYATEDQWRRECARIGLGGTDNADSQAKAFRRAYAALIDVYFYTDGKKVYLADKTDKMVCPDTGQDKTGQPDKK